MLARILRQTTRISGFVACTAGFSTGYVAHARLVRAPGDRALRDAWVKAWAASLLRLFAIEVRVVGALPPPPARGRLVVANHRSTIDVGLVLRTFGGRVLSKDDLAGWPVVGAAARHQGAGLPAPEEGLGGIGAHGCSTASRP